MKAKTTEELNRIFNAIITAMNAQKSINIASHGMDLFNHLVIKLFDQRTRLEWKSSTCDSFDPTEHVLMDFISKGILALNAANPKANAKMSSDPSRSAKSHFAKHGSDSSKCTACKGKHSFVQYSAFKAKPERKKVLR